jgi:phosphoglycerol transferase MdoB-like AlkP superfamily enzyme
VESTLQSLGVQRKAFGAPDKKDKQAGHPTLGPFQRAPKHIVMVSVESLSAQFVGAYGSKDGLTPNLDRFAAQGLVFENCLASGTRTVRGLEALSLGTPPVPGQAIVRRPHNEHLSSIGELLEHQGYLPLFVYGGYGYFDNMNAYFAGNDYIVVDRTDIPDEQIVFENAWGVADEVLMNTAIRAIDEQVAAGRPAFAHVMTTSNHRPYTYPDGRIDIPSPGGRKGAVRYTDYALGQLVEQAQQRSWFADTLFVFVADHCASAAGKTKLPVAGYRIPLIFYAPGLLPPGRESRLVSQIDVPPTLLGLLGKYGEDEFFGQNLFGDQPLVERAFISNYQELGYLRDGILTVLSPKQVVSAYRIDPLTLDATPMPIDEQRKKEAIAYYQSASAAFHSGKLLSPDYVSKK